MTEGGILLLGGSGQLGLAVRRAASERGVRLTVPGRSDLDLAADDPGQDLRGWLSPRPLAIILAAAMTGVDACETDEETAFRINGVGAGAVAAEAAKAGCLLIHVSTDYVFSGAGDRPWKPGDAPAPINAYGRSKLEGERRVMAAGGRSCIVRTSWLYGHGRRNFPIAILEQAAAASEISVVEDQVGSPCCCGDLAGVLLDLALAPGPLPPILHYANSGQCSWHEFALAIVRLAGWTNPVRPTTSDQLRRPARRPAYSVLDCDVEDLQLFRRPWAAALAGWLDELREQAPHLFPAEASGRGGSGKQ